MKQENGKKSKLWLWITLAAVAVVVAAGVIAGILFFNPGEGQVTEPTLDIPQSEIYWNIDRIQYTENSESGLSTREKGADGLYHIRFATQGKVVEKATADKQLVNYIDALNACGLVLDADGLIIEVLDINAFAVETAKGFYVKRFNENALTINSAESMNGLEMVIELSDKVCIMDVRPDSDKLGQSIDLGVGDIVSVYGTQENPNAYVFLSERPPASPLYLRVDQFYDSTLGVTTREPDENGVYTIPFAINGKIEQLKCKDKKVVSAIDAYSGAAQVMGLAFDSEGYISAKIPASTASRTKLVCSQFHITAINGNAVEATCIRTSSSDLGKVVNFTYDETTQFVMNETGCGHYVGELMAEPKLNDYVYVWTDMDDKAMYVKIELRKVDDVPMYYNVKKYSVSSSTMLTTRTKDADGYYVFELVSKGKALTAKTKDAEIAYKMDAQSHQIFGLKIKNGIIKEYYDRNCVSGGTSMGNSYYCTQLTGTIARIASGVSETGYNLLLTPETEIYDVTGAPGTKLGAKTELKEGDRVITARKLSGELTHIFVVDRYRSGCKLYYNLSPKYSSTTDETTRTPVAEGENEGYYVFDMACEGKLVQVKTKSKELATIIDKQSSPQVAALKVSNGVVKAAYGVLSGTKLKYKVYTSNYVSNISSDKTVNCVAYSSAGLANSPYTFKMAKNCQVYNVSNTYNKFKGEKTTLKDGDKIQALVDVLTKELTHIWVINRGLDCPLYMHVNRIAPTNGVTNRVPDANGYYSVELFADGKVKTYRTKSKDLMSRVDSYSATTHFAMTVKGDIIQKVDSYSSSLRGTYRQTTTMDIMGISGKTLSLKKMMPGQSTTGTTSELTYTSKTKIYNVDTYSESGCFKATKLKKGDRITAYMDREGEISYIFVTARQSRVKGASSKCAHCNKTVWWEPYAGSFIKTAGKEVIHYYLRADHTFGSVSAGYEAPETRFVLDLNGKTYTSTSRNFIVYSELTIMDSVGGSELLGNCNSSFQGGNIMVSGGSLTLRDGVTLRKNDSLEGKANYGGNIYVQNNVLNDKVYTGSLNIKNAKLEGWDCLDGGNIYMDAGTKLNISGGTITGGDIWVAKDVDVKLSGSTKIQGKGIDLTSGAKISESKLSGSAKVVVQANGTFTKKLSNATAQKAFYAPEFKYYPIEVKDSALWTDRDPSKPNFIEEPAIPAKPSVTSVNNAPLSLNANKQAKCPVCNKTVTWNAITKTDAYQVLANDAHYYLPADVNFTKADLPYIQVEAGATACLHLNNHNITATKAMAVMVNGTLNIMGNGTVSGNGYDNEDLGKKPTQAPATLGTDNANAVVNLYGGTYIKSAENDGRMVGTTNAKNVLVGIFGNGGKINLFDGATIDGRGYTTQTVALYNGKFNMYGGTVYGGSTHAINLTTWSSSKNGIASFYGGTVNGGSTAVNMAKSSACELYIYGGTFNGNVVYYANSKVVLAGNPVLSCLKLPTEKDGTYEGKIILGKLTDGAKIGVSGTDAIAFQNENAASYKKYFRSLTFGKVIDVVDYAICSVDKVEENYNPPAPVNPGDANLVGVDQSILNKMNKGNTIDNSDEAFIQDVCPICGVVEWTEWKPTDGNVLAAQTLTEGLHHVFVDEAFDINTVTVKSGASLCIWLKEDAALSLTEGSTIVANTTGSTISFFGTGSIKDEYGGRFLDARNGATFNLYGGNFEYKTAISDVETGAITFYYGTAADGGPATVNIFNGATIGPKLNDNGTPDDPSDDTHDTANCSMNVYFRRAGILNMFGGTIRNGVVNGTGGGNVYVNYTGSEFNMYGGTIENGRNIKSSGRAGNLYVVAGATANIYGGTITGGYSAGSGGNIGVANTAAAVLNMYGGKVTNGEAANNGGNIYNWGTVNIGEYALIEGGKANNGGNIYVYRFNVTTSGLIRNGQAATSGGNIGVDGASQNTVVLSVTGGKIYGGKLTTGSGSNIEFSCTADKTGRKLEITGGTIVGDIKFDAFDSDDQFVISGAPQIVTSAEIDGKTQTAEKGIQINADVQKIDITGLTADARIAVTAAKGQVLTVANENAANLLGCFSVTGETLAVNNAGEIYVVA